MTESIRLLNSIIKPSSNVGIKSGNAAISPVINELKPVKSAGNIVVSNVGRFVATVCITVFTAVSNTGRYCTAMLTTLFKKADIFALKSAPVLSTPEITSANADSTPAYPFLNDAEIGIADLAILAFASVTACSAFS